MSWSRSITATPVADFPAALQVALDSAKADAAASDFQPTVEAQAQIDAAGKAAADLVASGIVGAELVQASLSGHANVDNSPGNTVSVYLQGLAAPAPAAEAGSGAEGSTAG